MVRDTTEIGSLLIVPSISMAMNELLIALTSYPPVQLLSQSYEVFQASLPPNKQLRAF